MPALGLLVFVGAFPHMPGGNPCQAFAQEGRDERSRRRQRREYQEAPAFVALSSFLLVKGKELIDSPSCRLKTETFIQTSMPVVDYYRKAGKVVDVRSRAGPSSLAILTLSFRNTHRSILPRPSRRCTPISSRGSSRFSLGSQPKLESRHSTRRLFRDRRDREATMLHCIA